MFLTVQTLSRFGNSYFGFFLFFFSISREEDTTSGAATNSGVINTVSLKLPAFWPEEVEVWFAQTEAQFAIKRIMDSRTKFYYVVSVLPQAEPSFQLLMSLAMLKSMKLLLSDGQGAPLNPRTNPHGNGRLLHLYQLLLLSPLQVLTMFTAVTIVNLETMLIDVFSPVPGLKTTSPAGRFIYSTCQFTWK